LIVLLEEPDAVRVSNPDGGVDSVLSAGSGYARAWQAKRFTKNVYIAKCIASLDDGIRNYGVNHYTFQFARDLTGGQEAAFAARLRDRHQGVTVDYWGKAKLLSLLLASPQGERIANNFYGDPTANAKALALALRAGAGPIGDAAEALTRLGSIADWFDQHDPFFDYPTSSRPSHLPGLPLYPGSAGAIEIVDRDSVRRIEAIPRNAEAMQLFGPAGHLEFDPNPEGAKALEAFNQAIAHGGTVEIDKGARLVFSRLPPAFRPLLAESEKGTIVFTGGRPTAAPWPATLTASSDRGQAAIDVDLLPTEAPDGWDAALEGAVGGLTVTALFRRTPGAGQMTLNWSYDPDEPQDLRSQARTLALVDAVSGVGELVITDRSGVRPELPMALSGKPVPEFLSSNLLALGWLIEISDWLGEDLALPDEGFTLEQFRLLAEVAYIVRTGESRMDFAQVTFQFPREKWEETRPILESGGQLWVELPLALPQFDVEIGKLVGGISEIRIASVSAIAVDGGEEIEVVVEPTTAAAGAPVFRLERGPISH
jgi:hypothetical protein